MFFVVKPAAQRNKIIIKLLWELTIATQDTCQKDQAELDTSLFALILMCVPKTAELV
jgi:hypothetical protein